MTPLTVGSPQQVIDRYAGMREHYGDYQRQLFLIDHAGLPLKTVLEQLDILGGEVVPVLRKELAQNRPAEVPDAPTHANRVKAAYGDQAPRAGGARTPTAATTSPATRRTATRPSRRAPRSVPPRPGREPEMTDAHGSPSSRRGCRTRRRPACSPTGSRLPRVKQLAERDIETDVDVFELRDYAHDITNNLLTGFAPPALESMINAVVSADAVIAVTPIFSTSYSGLFKSFIDVLDPDALTGKPVLIGANAGTARHSLAIDYAIRPLFTYLHAEPVPTGVFAASSDWGASGDQVAPLGERVDRGARELAEAIARREPRSIRRPVRPGELPRRGPLVRPPARRPRGGVSGSAQPLVEESERPRPGIRRIVGPVARARVVEERVRGVRVHVVGEVDARGGHRRPHVGEGVDERGVMCPVQREDGASRSPRCGPARAQCRRTARPRAHGRRRPPARSCRCRRSRIPRPRCARRRRAPRRGRRRPCAAAATADAANSGARIGASASRRRGWAAVRRASSGSAISAWSSSPSSGVTPIPLKRSGAMHHVALGGEPVRDIRDVRHEPPDLVDQDDPAAWRSCGSGAIGGQTVEVDRRHAPHSSTRPGVAAPAGCCRRCRRPMRRRRLERGSAS